MMGMGGARTQPKGMVGGNLYVVDGIFVQRRIPSVEDVKDESNAPLPAEEPIMRTSEGFEAKASLPGGAARGGGCDLGHAKRGVRRRRGSRGRRVARAQCRHQAPAARESSVSVR